MVVPGWSLTLPSTLPLGSPSCPGVLRVGASGRAKGIPEISRECHRRGYRGWFLVRLDDWARQLTRICPGLRLQSSSKVRMSGEKIRCRHWDEWIMVFDNGFHFLLHYLHTRTQDPKPPNTSNPQIFKRRCERFIRSIPQLA